MILNRPDCGRCWTYGYRRTAPPICRKRCRPAPSRRIFPRTAPWRRAFLLRAMGIFGNELHHTAPKISWLTFSSVRAISSGVMAEKWVKSNRQTVFVHHRSPPAAHGSPSTWRRAACSRWQAVWLRMMATRRLDWSIHSGFHAVAHVHQAAFHRQFARCKQCVRRRRFLTVFDTWKMDLPAVYRLRRCRPPARHFRRRRGWTSRTTELVLSSLRAQGICRCLPSSSRRATTLAWAVGFFIADKCNLAPLRRPGHLRRCPRPLTSARASRARFLLLAPSGPEELLPRPTGIGPAQPGSPWIRSMGKPKVSYRRNASCAGEHGF